MKKKVKKLITNYIIMTIFCITYAVGIGLFLDPNNLAPGGVSGISIMLNRLTGLEVGTWIIILNIPILLLGLWKFGFKLIVSTMYCTFLSSAILNMLARYDAITQDKLLAAITGASLVALSIGMIFKAGATTGGIDIIIKVIKTKYPHMKTGGIFFCTDATIVALSGILFRDIETALYAAIAVVTCSMVMDVVLYGRDGAKMIYIISDKWETVTQRLLLELDIGVTHIEGYGAFSGREKKVIMCVMRKQLAPRIEEVVKEEDPEAFMIVTDATEIFGEGYKSYFSEKL